MGSTQSTWGHLLIPCHSTISLHTMRSQVVSVLFLGLMACTAMANVPVHPKFLGVHGLVHPFFGVKVPVPNKLQPVAPLDAADVNNDGVADVLDRNRDGKADKLDFPTHFVVGHVGFPFLHPAVLPAPPTKRGVVIQLASKSDHGVEQDDRVKIKPDVYRPSADVWHTLSMATGR